MRGRSVYLEGTLLAVAAEALDDLAVDAEPQHRGRDLVVVCDGVGLHRQGPAGRPCNQNAKCLRIFYKYFWGILRCKVFAILCLDHRIYIVGNK